MKRYLSIEISYIHSVLQQQRKEQEQELKKQEQERKKQEQERKSGDQNKSAVPTSKVAKERFKEEDRPWHNPMNPDTTPFAFNHDSYRDSSTISTSQSPATQSWV